MSNYLMRDAAPLSAEEWAKIDGMIVHVVKNVLVGRRFIDLVGPLGWGVEMAPLFGFDYKANVTKEKTDYLRLDEYSQEFMLRAKQQAIAENTPFGLDLGAVAIAATKLAKAEDKAIMDGLAKQAKLSGALGDWSVPGVPFKAVADATASLLQAGCDAPYALVVSPQRYAQLASLVKDGIREIELVEKLVKGGILQCTVLDGNQALVVSLASWNMDLVVGQDVVTAYIGNEGMDQKFRILETFALRIKRPESICLLK